LIVTSDYRDVVPALLISEQKAAEMVYGFGFSRYDIDFEFNFKIDNNSETILSFLDLLDKLKVFNEKKLIIKISNNRNFDMRKLKTIVTYIDTNEVYDDTYFYEIKQNAENDWSGDVFE